MTDKFYIFKCENNKESHCHGEHVLELNETLWQYFYIHFYLKTGNICTTEVKKSLLKFLDEQKSVTIPGHVSSIDIDAEMIQLFMETNYKEAMKNKSKEKVYVTWDPLLERVVCVHKTEDGECEGCEKIHNERSGAYYLENSEFLIKD